MSTAGSSEEKEVSKLSDSESIVNTEGIVNDTLLGNDIVLGNIFQNNAILLPLEILFKPKEDITTFELAQCIPLIIRRTYMRYEIDPSLPFMRHFEVIDHNK